MPEFPFHPDLYSFSSYRTLTVNDAVFIFGGWGNGLPLADVAKFENNIWYKMTDLLRWDFELKKIFLVDIFEILSIEISILVLVMTME